MGTTEGATAPHLGRRWLSALSAVLIVLGLVLGTASVLTGYVRSTLADTDGFVATFAPLAADPEVQAVVSDAVTQAVEEAVDIPLLTSQVFDGIRSLGISDEASSALSLLEGPTVQGLRSLLAGIVRDVVASDAFAEVWTQALRVSHAQVISTLEGDSDAALRIGDSGLELQIGPIVDAVRERLLADGVSFANAIPAVDRRIVLVEDASLGQIATAYGLLIGLAAWLPLISLALLAGGMLLARGRRRALLVTAVAAASLMAVLGIALAVGRTVLVGQLVGLGGAVTPKAGGVVYDLVTGAMAVTALWIAIVAVAVALGSWAAGPGAVPRRLRSGVVTAANGIRSHQR
jgi:hypothetical protein